MKRSLETVLDDLASNLRAARVAAGISQEELALTAEIDRTYVSQIERGIGNPSVRVLVKLAACLRLDPADLLLSRRAKG